MNRIVKWFDSVDRLVDNMERADAETVRLQRSPYTQNTPLDCWLERDLIRVVVETSVRQFTAAMQQSGLTDDLRLQLQEEIDQRRAFINWLLEDDHSHVYVGLFPTRTTEPTPDEVEHAD